MDEILAKLRKSTKSIEEQPKVSDSIEDLSLNLSTLPESESESTYEPTSSQCQTPFQINKLNFEKIIRLRDNDCITLEDVIKTPDYKIKSTLVCIIHKIIRFSKDAVCLEVADETGVISCSCTGELLKEENFKIGSLIKLINFSLWKVDGNHINLVKENIIND